MGLELLGICHDVETPNYYFLNQQYSISTKFFFFILLFS